MTYKFQECKDCLLTRETIGRDRCNTHACPAKSKAVNAIRGELAALRETCNKCEEKNCTLACPTKRSKDRYEKLQKEGRRSR